MLIVGEKKKVKKYTCIFYETTSGRCPAEEFVDSLEESTYDKFLHKKELLEDHGPQLRFPHTAPLDDGISELRFKGREGQIRVLFFFYVDKTIVLNHGFVKKTQKTPKKEIELARRRRKDFLNRKN